MKHQIKGVYKAQFMLQQITGNVVDYPNECAELANRFGKAFNSNESEGISISPNPVANDFYIVLPDQYKGCELAVIDVMGKVVLQSQMSFNFATFDVSGLANGIYILRACKDNLPASTKRFIKQSALIRN